MSSRTAAIETYRGRNRRRLLRRRQLGPPAAGVRQRQAPARPRQRLGPGGAQLHVPQQLGGPGRLEGAEPDPAIRRRSASTTSTSAGPAPTIRSATSRWSASRRRRCSGAKSTSPSWRRCGRWRCWPTTRVDFWLSTEDLPRPENRVTLESDGSIRLSYTQDQRGAGQAARTLSSSRCSATSGCTRTICCPATST